ncbi:hypothetical protein QVD17_36875 [Tagetes erecta]|uniref:Homeobox domain-containing protein n=1 Tax=Tagetes erecta TaxID=13708 RepID=A0AAD8NC89_TARER|nr:hypothetical protein QVD17_36875 [Tagetes erecta]
MKPNPTSLEPSLTLALSGDHSCGGNSSFSNVRGVKREREQVAISDESNTSCGEEDHDDVNGKKKLRLTKAQSGMLEEAFKLHTTLSPQIQKQQLARELKLRPRQVEVWFQNRRARTKLKQTEVDCEYLKKCCKILTDENQKLRQQVQQLKQVHKVHMPQPPTATVTVCPSCEQIGDTTKHPFTNMGSKPYFFNPFTSSSAAC